MLRVLSLLLVNCHATFDIVPCNDPRALAAPDLMTYTRHSLALPEKRALLAVPVGRALSPAQVFTIRHFARRHYDVMLMHYADAAEEGGGEFDELRAEFPHTLQVMTRRLLLDAAGCESLPDDAFVGKYMLARVWLAPPLVNAHDYLLLWDEDVLIEDETRFDADVFLRLLHALALDHAHPGLTRNAHNAEMFASHTQHLTHHRGEIIAPAYSARLWRCLYPLLQDSWGWGLDDAAVMCVCACNRSFVLNTQAVAHADTGTSKTRPLAYPAQNTRHAGWHRYLALSPQQKCEHVPPVRYCLAAASDSNSVAAWKGAHECTAPVRHLPLEWIDPVTAPCLLRQ
jgi:hypothetical protein